MTARALWLALTLALSLHASTIAAEETRADDLRTLRERISRLQRDLARTTETRDSVSDELRSTETAISAANKRLHKLAEQRAAVNVELKEIERLSRVVSGQVNAQQLQLERLLYRQGTRGEKDALRLLLGGEDPNQAARDRYYLIQLSRAKARVLGGLRTTLGEQQRLAESSRTKSAELAEIGRKQEQDRAVLLAQQKQRKQVLDRIAGKIKAQRREIGTLKANESRLSRLIDGLGRITRKPATRPAKPGTVPLSNQATPDYSSFQGNFNGLRGKLRLPVRGDITNRYGTPRGEGAMTWKGLFIRAAEGTEVKAVAPGRVVFADWLRGFGNLLILDHGDGYLTIYGNNQSLLRDTGDEVRAGDPVAAVGNSGGNQESGLYFELRQQGQPVDPLKWASLR